MKEKTHKLNCWEYKKCGREPGGKKTDKLGICPTSQKTSVNGINGGINGGRICWLISGTYGKYKVEYADCIAVQNMLSCHHCDFHRMVLAEEGFLLSDTKIKKKSMDYYSL